MRHAASHSTKITAKVTMGERAFRIRFWSIWAFLSEWRSIGRWLLRMQKFADMVRKGAEIRRSHHGERTWPRKVDVDNFLHFAGPARHHDDTVTEQDYFRDIVGHKDH